MALRTLRIFISSPGDLAEERLIARRVIGRVESQIGDALHLEPIAWEVEPLVATASFQEQIVRPSEADIVIAMFWSRLGTILPNHIRREDGSTYASGTEFEFEDAIDGFRRRGKPDILAYRKTARPALPSDAAELAEHVHQEAALGRFLARWFHSDRDASLVAAIHGFASPADFEELLQAHLMRLVEPHLPAGMGSRSAAATWPHGSPFRGLEAFEPKHAQVFFGRTAAVGSVLMKLRKQAHDARAFVLVVGMSGGGKSSLVRAGVLPLMTQPGVLGTARRWRVAVVRPSDGQGDLDRALALGLAPTEALPVPVGVERANSVPADRWAAEMVAGLDTDGAGGECHLALLIDQLEEIFSDRRLVAADRKRFVDRLAALAASGRVWIVATLRSDAYPQLAELPGLVALKEGEGQFDLLAPSVREIGQIIRLPAAAAGLRFEARRHTAERLDDTIRDAAAKNPGALPLLQFLLEALYVRRDAEDVLTYRAYEELGGVEGALAQHAEAVLGSVSPDAQQTLPAVLRELVTFGGDDEAKALRRIAPLDAFDAPARRELVDALVAARLLVSALNGDGRAVISLAHEALLDFWPRLRVWRERDRELLMMHARLEAAARTWDGQGRRPDFLLGRGKPIADARALEAAGMRLSRLEAELVVASRRRGRRFEQLRGAAVATLAGLTVIAAVAAYRARVESERARIQATTAQRTTDFMTSLFSIADPEQSRGENVTAKEILERGVAQIRGVLGDEQAVRAKLLVSMGQAYDGLGLYSRALPLLTEAIALADAAGGPDLLQARMALATNRYLEADYEAAADLYGQSLAAAKRLHGERHALVSAALCGLGDSLVKLDRADEAERDYRQALDIDLTLNGERHADTARSLDALGRFFYATGRYADAEPLLRRALAIRREVYGDKHADIAISMNALASLLFQTGQYSAAEAAWADALPVYRSIYGNEHQEVAALLNNLGRVDLMRGEVAAADQHLSQALAIERKLLPAGHDDFVPPLNSLAMVRARAGDLDGARALLDEALGIARARQHWLLGQVVGNLADLEVRAGRPAPAREALAESRRLLEATYGAKLEREEAWRAAVLDTVESAADIAVGRPEEALQRAVRALPLLKARFGEHGLFTEEAREQLAEANAAVARASAIAAVPQAPALAGRGGAAPVTPIRRTANRADE